LRLKWLVGIALLAFAVMGCSTPYAKFAETPLTVTIIETSDIHGAFFPYNFITAKESKNSLAQISTIIAEERAKEGNEVILLENGDYLQGQPTVYYYNFEKTDTVHLQSEIFNYMKYDAVGVGNHDIEAGHPVYDKIIKEAKASFICANAIKEDGTPYFTPYVVIERQGVKIAILGLITPKIPDWLPSQFWSGMTFEDMIVSAKKWIPIIKEKENPALIVGLFHAGVDYTYGGVTADKPSNENASQLVAEQVSGFDLILVGHDHQGWSGQGWDPVAKAKKDVMNPDGQIVPIFGPNNAGRNVAVVTFQLKYDLENETWIKSYSGELKSTEGVAPDAEFMAMFQPQYDAVKAWVSRPVGIMEGTITTRDSLWGDSEFVDLIHKIQFEVCADPANGLKKADISFAAPLSLNATIPSSADGTLFVRDMFNLYVYENFLYTMELTGQQVKDFLEFSYGMWYNTMASSSDHLIAFQKDAAGNLIKDERTGSYKTMTSYYNYDSAAGIVYTVDVSKPMGSRIAIKSMADGTSFDLAKTYSVAINSYRAQGGGGHLEKGAKLVRADILGMKFVTSSTVKDLRFYLLKWFEKQTGVIKPTKLGNWSVIPADWAAAGRALDFPLIYPSK
jgi:2',3'-cyclic-nucleotide 2'-phosphodiesterase/3'-nucleotidase